MERFTGVSWKALAIIAILLIDADTAVTARIAGALVHVDGTLGSRPSWLAGAIITARLQRDATTNEATSHIYQTRHTEVD